MKSVWVTKTGAVAQNKSGKNLKFLVAPLLHVMPASRAPKYPRKDDCIIFTSRNGVNAFCELTAQRNWPVYAVGDATAKIARQNGFKDVRTAGGNVSALRALILSDPMLKTRRLYYAGGQDVSGNLEADLTHEGFNIVRSVLYETQPLPHLPDCIQSALATNRSLTVLLYSPKGARAFGALKLDFELIDTVSISANVDAELEGLCLKTRKIAKNPTHQDMLKEMN